MGPEPWPKLFQNLRSTRETEPTEKWPEHVVCVWIGNSRSVAREHYLQVTDERFAQATMQATQNGAHPVLATSRDESQPACDPVSCGQQPGIAGACGPDEVRVKFAVHERTWTHMWYSWGLGGGGV